MTLAPITYKFHPTKKPILTPTELRRRLEYAKTVKIPHLVEIQPHIGVGLIVGAAPSVEDYIVELRKRKSGANSIFSLNGAHQYLMNYGIAPRIHVLFEEDIDTVQQSLGGDPNYKTYYYISSRCKPEIFEQLEGYHRVLWHSFDELDGYGELLNEVFPGEFAVGLTGLTFFRTIAVARVLGYRKLELYGCDSSFRDGKRYLPGYHTEDTEELVSVWGTDPRTDDKKEFKTVGLLAFQAEQFIVLCRDHPDLEIQVHGDGLLKYVHESRYPNQYTSEGPK